MILDRPPPGWKRPATSTRAKLDVLIRQEGRCAQTGEKLGSIDNTRFDHRPALWERKFDTEAWDTIPPANDSRFIDAVTIKAHDVRTHGPGGEKRITTYGSDSHNRAKDTALKKSRQKHVDAMARKARGEPKPKSRWPSRPMAKRRK